MDATKQKTSRFYYIDESGDSTIFGRKGRVLIGTPGCSQFFVMGLLEVTDPALLTQQMSDLRTKLLADPYFRGVPSFDPTNQKTAVFFHAKDDLPEVRREVFALLNNFSGLRFHAVIRDKREVLKYVQQRNKTDPQYRYHPNERYDYLVRRLTKTLLHRGDRIHVIFASRGNKDRTVALKAALLDARARFEKHHHRSVTSNLSVESQPSHKVAGLQGVDYFLWALQRLIVHRQDRFWNYVWPACGLVVDIDDTREKEYGKYYTQKRPLDLAALDGR